MPTRMVRGSRLSSLMFSVFCLGGVLLGFSPNVLETGVPIQFVQGCFGFGAVAGVVGVCFPGSLTLHPDRFEARTIFGVSGARWAEVEVVFIELRYIVWRLRRPGEPDGLLSTLHRMTAIDGRIAGRGWTLSKYELVELMEDYRRAAPADA